MFGIILLTAITIFQIYIFSRILSVQFIVKRIPKFIIILIGLFFWLCFFVGRFWGHDSTGNIAYLLEFIGMTWMGILFLTFIPVLLVDIVTVFGLLFKRYKGTMRGIAVIIGILLSAIALVQGLRPPVITKYNIKVNGLSDDLAGLKIIAFSDSHLGMLIGHEWLEQRIKQVSAQNPDIVLLLGDISEGHGESSDDLLPVLKQLSAPLGVWGVLGNHEFYSSRSGGISLLEKSNINLLRNKWAEIKPGLVLAGIDDPDNHGRPDAGMENDIVDQALKKKPEGTTIFLSHSPVGFMKAAELGADIMLCGHTHGGQIWPFGCLVGLRYKYIEGLHEIGNMKLIITHGAGTWGPRMRLWRPGEIVLITLNKKN